MHKLDRSAVAEPACLASYSYPQHTWEDVSSSDKSQIRNSLKKMQDCRCAYCEGPIYSNPPSAISSQGRNAILAQCIRQGRPAEADAIVAQ